jgi:hypothetical protein
VCSTNGSTPYIYGTISQGIPITTVTFANIATPLPPFYFNIVGKFNINASCSSTLNYTANNIDSKKVVIATEVPVITFSKSLINGITYAYNLNYPLPQPIATVNNNIQNISYSIVSAIDGESASTVATINPEGTQLLINSVGTFKIKASVKETTSLDFSPAEGVSIPIVISPATPQVIFGSTFMKQVTYFKQSINSPNSTYQILGVSTTNTDNPAIALSYSSDTPSVATISGNVVSMVSAGNFKIYVSCPPTTNFNGLSGATSAPSPPITIIKATPVITFLQGFSSTWGFNSPTPYSLIGTGITCNNTDSDSNDIQYKYTILNQNPKNVALSPITASQIKINNAGSFKLQVQSLETKNYFSSLGHFPVIIPQLTPIIIFPNKFVSSWKYGNNPYTFTAAQISNNDPSQKIIYSIIPISSPNNIPAASFSDPTNPASITINSVGTFKIQASCGPTTNGYYTSANQLFPASPSYITVTNEVPNIVFNTANFNTSYLYAYSNTLIPTPYTFTSSSPIASITPNPGGQILTYSAVEIDNDDILSTVATIFSDGTSLTTKSVGSFRILVETASMGLDYGAWNIHSGIITINRATPTITSRLDISPPLPFIYDVSYNIPYPPTSNTDATSAQIVSYSTDNPDIISISGTVISVTGVGNFQILVTIALTANYDAVTYTYPSGLVYTPAPGVTYASYKAGQATPDITFNVDQSATYDTSYNLVPVRFITGDPSTQNVTYSIQ